MDSLHFLNSRQKKDVLEQLEEQYGFSGGFDGHLLKSNKDKLYLLSDSEFLQQGLDARLRIDRAGLHLGTFSIGGIRLSVEGSQIVGPFATRQIVDIDVRQLESWVKGEDLVLSEDDALAPGKDKCFMMVRSGSDFLGCGFLRGKTLENNLSKTRRVKNFNK